jgi:hypothetical protein
MYERDKTEYGQRDADRFSAALDELNEIKDAVVKDKGWYERNAKRPMVLFRIVGVSLIVLSVSVPFLGPSETRASG